MRGAEVAVFEDLCGKLLSRPCCVSPLLQVDYVSRCIKLLPLVTYLGLVTVRSPALYLERPIPVHTSGTV